MPKSRLKAHSIMMERDPVLRDRKKLSLSTTPEVILPFLVCLFVIFPVWIIVLLPLSVICVIWKKLTDSKVQVVQGKDIVPLSVSGVPSSDRVFDIILFGATGFTGKMAAVYLAKNYGSKVKWAIAGRRKAALEQVQQEIVTEYPALQSIPILIADSSNVDSLNAMCKQTKVVISTAGPFGMYGSELVKSCVVNGTHYCDITGETDWVRRMVDLYDNAAKQTGARIVSFCGHDCVPWDLAVLEASERLASRGEQITEINCFDEVRADPSGGTMATIFYSLTNRERYESRLGFDPLLKEAGTDTKSENKLISKNQTFLGYSKEFQAWVGPFVMAMVMCNCVRRSNALNKYSSKIIYREAQVYPSFMAGFVTVTGLAAFGTSLMIPPLSWFLQKFILPKPGQGPSETSMNAGWLKVTAFAKGSKGGKTRVEFYFPTDPGYRDTARILVESGLVLALQAHEIKVGGGLWTPAACQVRTGNTQYLITSSRYLVFI